MEKIPLKPTGEIPSLGVILENRWPWQTECNQAKPVPSISQTNLRTPVIPGVRKNRPGSPMNPVGTPPYILWKLTVTHLRAQRNKPSHLPPPRKKINIPPPENHPQTPPNPPKPPQTPKPPKTPNAPKPQKPKSPKPQIPAPRRLRGLASCMTSPWKTRKLRAYDAWLRSSSEKGTFIEGTAWKSGWWTYIPQTNGFVFFFFWGGGVGLVGFLICPKGHLFESSYSTRHRFKVCEGKPRHHASGRLIVWALIQPAPALQRKKWQSTEGLGQGLKQSERDGGRH